MERRVISVDDLENNLSALLARVRRGEEILICDGERIIAKLVPVLREGDFTAEELDLAARGLVRLPKKPGPLPASSWKVKVPRPPTNRVLEVLREDRDRR